jgi:Genetic competence transcription factor
MLEEYEINSSTLAIIPIDDKTSQVYEDEEEYIVNKSTNKIIDYNCKFYGSSYRGRCEGTRYLTGVRSKCPIIIEESRNIIFFPTSSIRSNDNSWISLNRIKEYKSNFYGTSIIFNNDKILDIPISYYSIDNQFCRSNLLKVKLYELKSIKK